MTALTECDLPRRSFHGLSTTKKEPIFEAAPPAMKLCPETDMTFFTSGMAAISLPTVRITESVRSRLAPTGSWTDVMK